MPVKVPKNKKSNRGSKKTTGNRRKAIGTHKGKNVKKEVKGTPPAKKVKGTPPAKKFKTIVEVEEQPMNHVKKAVVKKKRVSFASELQQETVSGSEVNFASASFKSILKTRKTQSEAFNSSSGGVNDISNAVEPQTSKKDAIIMSLQAKERILESKIANKSDPAAEKRLMRIRKLKRRLKKHPNYEVVIQAKKLWEVVRSGKTKVEERESATSSLCELVAGRIKEFLNAHDAVRIVQCLMKLKREDIRTLLFDEVKDDILALSKSKYSRFFVIKMMKHGTPSQRQHIIKSFYGHIPELMRHAVAADCVEFAYNEYASALQRWHYISEFLGPEFALFKGDEVLSISKVLQDDTKRLSIMKNLKSNLLKFSTKPCFRHSLVHCLLADYFENCSNADRPEVIDAIKERVLEFVHTRYGCIAALHCVWHGSVKDRKLIIKSMKGLVLKLCTDEHAYLFVLGILECVDDTVLISKIILQELLKSLTDIVNNKYGLKVVHCLLSPRDPHYLYPDVKKLLSQGDGNAVSRKDPAVRHKELIDYASEKLIQYAASRARELLFDQHTSLLLYNIIRNAAGNKSELMTALAEVAAEDFVPGNIEGFHLIEHPQAHFTTKLILKLEKERKTVDATLCEALISAVSEENLSSWICCNKGAFILVAMLETGNEDVSKALIPILRKTVNQLKGYSFNGAKILLQKVAV